MSIIKPLQGSKKKVGEVYRKQIYYGLTIKGRIPCAGGPLNTVLLRTERLIDPIRTFHLLLLGPEAMM